jgi:Kae1-associated kinase Bud32
MIQINEGAEAKIYKTEILGKEMVLKRRETKKYRVKELDEKLRKERTRTEARIITRLSGSGIKVPRIAAIGLFSIYMEKLSGKLLKDLKPTVKQMTEAGELLARMHEVNVAHGDFTPANLMLCNNQLYVIDFGLSEVTNSSEEKALDLLLMKRSVSPKLYSIFENSYRNSLGKSTEIINRLKEIEKRGRYQTRTLA